MILENELQLLSDTLKKCHVKTAQIEPEALGSALLDTDLLTLLGRTAKSREPKVTPPSPMTMYKHTNALGLCYIYFLLPQCDRTPLFLVGPYLTKAPTKGDLLELGEKNGATPKTQRYLEEYCESLAVLTPSNPLLLMISTFCEHAFESPSFSIVDTADQTAVPASPISEPTHSDNLDDVLLSMKTMEARYGFENELMQAVTLGQLHKESMLQSAFSVSIFEKRAQDPLRNAKNYCIIMNTLLRKAAEEGGVHPVYLDSVSAGFALKIEQTPALSHISPIMHDMFRAYCRLVRKHATNKYSHVVEKTILLIDSDLSAPLSLHALAAAQGVTPPYLSTVFKRETGQTVSAYIRERRIRHATHLLATTHLQIQTVALHCGIMDVQYFSKIFKRQTGKTPKEYREDVKQAQK